MVIGLADVPTSRRHPFEMVFNPPVLAFSAPLTSTWYMLAYFLPAQAFSTSTWRDQVPSGVTKCCHWRTRPLECTGAFNDRWLCPASCACPGAGWFPQDWVDDEKAGSLLLASPDEMGGTIGNGYVGELSLIHI